jgi:hypothetical protein
MILIIMEETLGVLLEYETMSGLSLFYSSLYIYLYQYNLEGYLLINTLY